MAALLGIDVDRTISLTFVLGAALAAVAGTMYLLYYGVVNFSDGFVPGVKAFTAAVLGGIGSLPGAVLGGLIIGLDRDDLVGLLLDRVQGRGGLLDPRHRADLHAVGHPRPARGREGLMAAAPTLRAADRSPRWPASCDDAALAALVAFGLCVPIIASGPSRDPAAT